MTTIAYGTHPDQVADLHLPPSGAGRAPAPLVLLLHGGFWREPYDRSGLTPLAGDLASRGWAVLNAEYRRVGGDGGWPTTFLDVARAVDVLPDEAGRVAGGAVDTGRVFLLGHSAGGHLALWAALRHRLPEGSPGRSAELPGLAGVVALAPVADLRGTYDLGSGRGAVADLLGGGPAQVADRYAAADPAALGKVDLPTVVVHGERDENLPVEMARRYAAAVGARLVTPGNCGHFDLVDPRSPAWRLVVGALDDLLATSRE
ncbi:alpha/beta hydrolase family protein [Kitasatospora sp. DSM 101779]|uniref:alpha/beta hydrolase family protein n=1 Tax=Kitasatospora sp. DSM 101779 TaxID=2853165 RepID=UPI0021D8706E|nr:alpha/beta hydrolase [Kitasatospora sp. DSM 101779]MCU7826518.1 alpha/beta hydrolase [Kitasatospora sp. DSM 101779]